MHLRDARIGLCKAREWTFSRPLSILHIFFVLYYTTYTSEMQVNLLVSCDNFSLRKWHLIVIWHNRGLSILKAASNTTISPYRHHSYGGHIPISGDFHVYIFCTPHIRFGHGLYAHNMIAETYSPCRTVFYKSATSVI